MYSVYCGVIWAVKTQTIRLSIAVRCWSTLSRAGGYFFQRPKECGGGYWLGRTYHNVFMIEYERPVSLSEGMIYLTSLNKVEARSNDFDENFSLF